MEPSISPSEQFHVRTARPEDVPALLRMSWQLAVSQKVELMFRATREDYLRDGFGPDRQFSAFVAERGQTVIGMVTYSDRYSTGLASPILYVQDIFVDDRHRTRGIGTALLARVAAEATSRGLPLIELTMRDGNPAAKIYRRCGFSRVPHSVTFALAGQTLIELAQQFADAALAVGM
jgi:GNAT superfamily N-acetyltransferase